MYTLRYDEKVIEYLEKLDTSVSKRIINKIQQTKDNPHRFFIRLTSRPEYKLRVGNYRIIADIIDNELLILVVLIDHRSKVYKKL